MRYIKDCSMKKFFERFRFWFLPTKGGGFKFNFTWKI